MSTQPTIHCATAPLRSTAATAIELRDRLRDLEAVAETAIVAIETVADELGVNLYQPPEPPPLPELDGLDAAIETVLGALGDEHSDLARVLIRAIDGPVDPADVAELRRIYGLHDLSETPRALDLGRQMLWFGRVQPECVRAAARATSSRELAELLESAISEVA